MKAVTGTSLATGEVIQYPSIAAAGRDGGFDVDCIGLCVKGLARHHAGFEWVETGKPKAKAVPSKQVKVVAKLRNSGFSNREIAERTGISYGMIRVYAGRAITAGLCAARKRGGRE
ncbi:hypothetical protein Ahp2_67 [Aeromonas phage Ahp2]|nr:hypothetical protein Ahp2_67 [Aeromonas phage Ahp2]